MKRALRNFGNLLGNCLYDKAYTAEIVKVKVEPVSDHSDLNKPWSNGLQIQPKFNKDELHRRPEFQDVKPKVPTAPISAQQNPAASKPHTNFVTPTRLPTVQNQAKPPNPSHLSSEVQQGTTSSASTSNHKQVNGIPRHTVQTITPATTPLHNPQPERQPQHQPQQPKRVSFVNSAAQSSVGVTPSVTLKQEADAGSDDSYGLNDEEFLVTLAEFEADIGRPIGEGDLGRPIDHEEGTSLMTNLVLNEGQGSTDDSVRQPQQQTSNNMNRSLSREAAIAAALQAHAEEAERTGTESTTILKPATTTSTRAPGSMVASGATAMPPPAPNTDVSMSSKSSSDSSRPTVPPEPARKTFSSLKYQRYMQYVGERQQNQNQFGEQKQADQKPQSGSVPSMGGGFNFPPGTVRVVYACLFSECITRFQSMAPPAVIGVKRPADAMLTSFATGALGPPSVTSFKGGRPGMGLQPVTPAPRQILGALEVGEGGDVKRVKR